MSLLGFAGLRVLATALALAIAVAGAVVRLSNAGLSCSDWPGCYGQLLVPIEEGGAGGADGRNAKGPLLAVITWPVPPARRFSTQSQERTRAP